jgi:plasmid stabilization system protein ParE
MRIRWTPPAAQDMQGISDYLKERHPQYRLPTMRKLYRKIQSLKQTPHLGRPGRIEGTREIVFTPLPYVGVYRVEDEIVEIWRIWHAAQERLNVVMEKNRLRPQVLAPF